MPAQCGTTLCDDTGSFLKFTKLIMKSRLNKKRTPPPPQTVPDTHLSRHFSYVLTPWYNVACNKRDAVVAVWQAGQIAGTMTGIKRPVGHTYSAFCVLLHEQLHSSVMPDIFVGSACLWHELRWTVGKRVFLSLFLATCKPKPDQCEPVVKLPDRYADHLFVSGVEVKNKWSFFYTAALLTF